MNGLTVLVALVLVFGGGGLIAYAKHRMHEQDAMPVEDDPGAFDLADDLAIARAVRRSYDGLPYRGGKGWSGEG